LDVIANSIFSGFVLSILTRVVAAIIIITPNNRLAEKIE